MYKLIYLFIAVSFISCRSTTYFIVRHAEKETTNTMTTDVPLSEAGKQRAQALKDMLQNEKLTQIYSTNYIRTRTTAEPLANALTMTIQTYNPGDSVFISRMRTMSNANVLIVGHSNTVDDLVNKISGEQLLAGDLPDTQYGDLFIVKKKGSKIKYEVRHFGK